MLAQVIHPETGEIVTMDIPDLKQEDFYQLTREFTRDDQLKAHIERIPVSAEAKVMLFKLSKFTISLGDTTVRVGKKILEIVMMLADKYKSAAFGLIIACILTLLIASIPLLGPPLASILFPLLALFGIAKGVWEDLKRDTPKLANSIEDAAAIFNPLNPKIV